VSECSGLVQGETAMANLSLYQCIRRCTELWSGLMFCRINTEVQKCSIHAVVMFK